jgi:predicted HNH restriction endonuclease
MKREFKEQDRIDKSVNTFRSGACPGVRGLRLSPGMSLWRKTILAYDKFTCQGCKVSGGKLHVHHINNFNDFPELRFALDNGITLCPECHRDFHKEYGRSNNTAEQLDEWSVNH